MAGTRQRDFAGTNSKPRKLPENAQTPTTTAAWFAKQTTGGASVAPALFAGDRVHAVLGAFSIGVLHNEVLLALTLRNPAPSLHVGE